MTDSTRRLDSAELLAHAGWLRALARTLVRDDADDVVQATMLAAVRTPPREGVPLGPWLARVARNLSFNTRRAAARRALHEHAVAPAPQPESPADSVARAEMFEEVVRAVLALEPIHRDVVLLRFFDGLEMTEVAARLSVPVETARTRLKRALAVLRERLDRKYDARAGWALVLAPASASSPETGDVPTAAASGVLTAARLAAAVLVAGVVAAAWVALRPRAAAVEDGPAAQSVETAAAPRARIRAASEVPAATDAASETAAVAVPKRWVLRGRLTGLEPGEAGRTKLSVYVWTPVKETASRPHWLELAAPADGTFAFEVPLAGDSKLLGLTVVADHPDYRPAATKIEVPEQPVLDTEGTAVLTCDVAMRRAAVIAVKVVDERGDPVAGARIAAFRVEDRAPREWPDDRAETDAAGAARLRTERAAKCLVVASKAGLAPSSAAADGDDARITMVLHDGETIRGRVTQSGTPVGDARVRARCGESGGRTLDLVATENEPQADGSVEWHEDGSVSAHEVLVSTAADGRYAVTGLRRGVWTVEVVADGGGRELMGFWRQVLRPSPDVDFEIATAHVVVEVRSGSEPVEGVWLGGLGSVATPKTGPDGRAEADVAPGGRYQIWPRHDGYRETTVPFVAPSAGGTDVVAISLEPLPRGSVAVSVRDAEGRPVNSASLALFRDAASQSAPEHFTLHRESDDGRFVATGIEPGRWRLVVRAGRNWYPDFTWNGDEGTWLDAAADVDVGDGEEKVEVIVRRGGRLRIAARDAKGTILAAECVLLDESGATVSCSFATRYGDRGAYSAGAGRLGWNAPSDVDEVLPAGRYRVKLSHDGFEEKTVDAVVEAGRTCVVDVTMEGGEAPSRPVLVSVPESPR